LYKPIGKLPYKEAGIKGFEPPQLFTIVEHFARCGNFHNFHFPTLSKLNNKFKPFPWSNDDEQQRYMSDDVVEMEPILYNGPLPSPAVIQVPSIPPISILVRSIINLSQRLFFISHSLGNPSIQEWRLVRVNLSNSTSLSSSCLQDGQFLVDFYTLHFNDVRFNAMNQRYWLQYHWIGNIATPTTSTTMRLIHPSDSSEAFAAKN
jgi:hypothetical protein